MRGGARASDAPVPRLPQAPEALGGSESFCRRAPGTRLDVFTGPSGVGAIFGVATGEALRADVSVRCSTSTGTFPVAATRYSQQATGPNVTRARSRGHRIWSF